MGPLNIVTVATFNTQNKATVATFATQNVATFAMFNTQNVSTPRNLLSFKRALLK